MRKMEWSKWFLAKYLKEGGSFQCWKVPFIKLFSECSMASILYLYFHDPLLSKVTTVHIEKMEWSNWFLAKVGQEGGSFQWRKMSFIKLFSECSVAPKAKIYAKLFFITLFWVKICTVHNDKIEWSNWFLAKVVEEGGSFQRRKVPFIKLFSTEPSEPLGLGTLILPYLNQGGCRLCPLHYYLLLWILRPSYVLATNVPWLLKGVKSWLLPNVSGAKKIPSGEEQKIEDKMKPSLVTLSSVSQ